MCRLVETDFPFAYVARCGIQDLLQIAGDKVCTNFFVFDVCVRQICVRHSIFFFVPHLQVLPVIPQLILPIKNALHTKDRGVVNATLSIIRTLLRSGK